MKSKCFNKIVGLILCITMLFGCFTVMVHGADTDLSDDIVILYTNDIHTYIDGPLSYDVIAAIKKDLEKEYKYVILADAGDHIQGTAYGSMDKGKNIINMMNAAGYDVAILGNHEFDYGMEGCKNTIEWAEFPYISCNFFYEEAGIRKENVLNSYVSFDCGDEKIAFVGITTPETFTKSTPAYFQDENGNYIYGIAGGNDGKALYADVQNAVNEAKAAGATKVIALGHLGDGADSVPFTSVDTIANVTGLDAFIDGHSHSTVKGDMVADKEGKNVLLTQTGEYFDRIGVMVIDSQTGAISTDFIETYNNADEGVKAIKEAWIATIDNELNKKIGYANVVFDNYLEGYRAVRSRETNMGDFCADALYYLFDSMDMDVDVAIMNGGGIRNNNSIYGDITYKTCKEIHTFGNVACLQKVTGQQLLDALEWGARFVGKGENGGFLQVSGLLYDINDTITETTQMDDKGVWIGGPTGEYRVHNVKVYNKETNKWEALELDKEYNLAGYNYTLRDLGDGFSMFEGAENVIDYVMEDYMVLSNYVKAFENCIIDETNSPILKKYPNFKLDYDMISGCSRIEIDSEQVYDIWVAGTRVTGLNANDILGDGTVSYDSDTNTLILNNVNITSVHGWGKGYEAGVYADCDLNIELNGTQNIIKTTATSQYSCGIYVDGDLNIFGDGTLQVESGDVTANNDYADSIGIEVKGNFRIEKAFVISKGGNAFTNDEYVATSNGIITKGNIDICLDGSLVAIGGEAKGMLAYSEGVKAYKNGATYINISVYDGYLEATGGKVSALLNATSNGIHLEYGGLYVYDKDAKVILNASLAKATSTIENEQPFAFSNGIFIGMGAVLIKDGNVEIFGGEYEALNGTAHAVYIDAKELFDENKVTAVKGGTLNIECDNVEVGKYTPALVGTRVTIKSVTGPAIYTKNGIKIGDTLFISTPSIANVEKKDYWTITDSAGNEAQDIYIEPICYKVTINDFTYNAKANVPANKSLNEAYCDFYGVTDFSQVIKREKEGYIFAGWYTDEACTEGNKYDFNTPVTKDITLYAKWVDANSPVTKDDNNLNMWLYMAFACGGVILATVKTSLFDIDTMLCYNYKTNVYTKRERINGRTSKK